MNMSASGTSGSIFMSSILCKRKREIKMSKNNLEVKVERMIAAAPGAVFDAWLNRKTPGTPWNMSEKILLTPKKDGFFCWLVHGTPHHGRCTDVKRGSCLQHSWMSPYTLGQETIV